MRAIHSKIRQWWWIGALGGVLVLGSVAATAVAMGGSAVSAVPAAPVAPAAAPVAAGTPVATVAPLLPSFAPIVARLAPTVVSIDVVQRVRLTQGEGNSTLPMPFFFGGGPFGNMNPFGNGNGRGGPPPEMESRGAGSGVIVDPAGYVLTNAHVVKDASEITVQVNGGDSLPGEVVGIDEPTDLAVVRIHPSSPLPAATLGDSDAVAVGDWVLAIGNPFGLEHTVTTGIVSAKERRTGDPDEPYGDFLQTDASINPGNSGGPLFDLSGKVVGINTAINAAGQGIGFAIPSNMAHAVYEQLKAHGHVDRSWIGVTIQPVTPELAESFGLTGSARGALVAEVQSDSPASRAGLHVGDIILRFDDSEIHDAAELPWLASTAGIGHAARLQVFRDGNKRDVTLTLTRMPAADSEHGSNHVTSGGAQAESSGGLGIQVQDVPQQMRAQLGIGEGGAVITDVAPGGAGAEHGLQPGDVVLQVNGHAVSGADDLAHRIGDASSGSIVRLQLRTQDGTRFIGIRKR